MRKTHPILAPLLGAMMCFGAFGQTEAAQKPNIIVILADDLGWNELGCYGQQKIRTPNLDRLAAEGQRWTQFYSGAPTCSASRNVLLTGRHTGGVTVQDLKRADPKETPHDLRGDWPMAAETYTIHRALAAAGYTTAAFGKWGMGEYGSPGAPDRHGVQTFFGYTDHRMCHTFYPPFLWKDGVKIPINTPGVPGHARQPEGEVKADTYRGQKHASEAILEEALEFVSTAAGASTPFFLYYCPLEPHVAMQPPQQWVDAYPEEWDAAPYRGENGYLPHPRPRAAYAATISFLDDHVGQLMRRLRETGADKNTLVVFTSDNGTTHDVGGWTISSLIRFRRCVGSRGNSMRAASACPPCFGGPARSGPRKWSHNPGTPPTSCPPSVRSLAPIREVLTEKTCFRLYSGKKNLSNQGNPWSGPVAPTAVRSRCVSET